MHAWGDNHKSAGRANVEGAAGARFDVGAGVGEVGVSPRARACRQSGRQRAVDRYQRLEFGQALGAINIKDNDPAARPQADIRVRQLAPPPLDRREVGGCVFETARAFEWNLA